ncbi:hypothetical protein CANDROIZ_10021 [Candidatus Roizmanbacteria bacterium]|nr:hypothetical protein CANDROIZ_10021 [Candidatus Roizmanbacteria bacterium]
MTDKVGSFVNSHGMIVNKAPIKIILSEFVISLLPFLREIKAINIVSMPVTPVVQLPGPPPFCHCPKKTSIVAIAQIIQVKTWGLVLLRKMSTIYGYRATKARMIVIKPIISFIDPNYILTSYFFACFLSKEKPQSGFPPPRE